MTSRNFGVFATLTALLVGMLIVMHFSDSGEKLKENTVANEPRVLLKCNFYNDKDFRTSVMQAKDYDLGSKQIYGGITPHHLLASSLIASFFKAVSQSKPEVVVIVAPNHKGTGVKNIHTGTWDWDTPYGVLKADTGTANLLINSKIAAEDEQLLQQDHSISGLIPYVKYYMPDAKVLPILLHGSLGADSAKQLGSDIKKMLSGKRYVVIASVDFSHYLTMEEADKKDVETLKALESRDYQRLAMFGNDHLDSPPSIITVMSAMYTIGASNFNLLEHSNAERIAKLKSDSTTSYFTVVFTK